MANKKGKFFSGRNGRRDWDEPEDNEYDDDEYEEDEEDESYDRPSLFSSARKLFGSRRQDDDEYEDDEDDEEEDEPKRRRSGFALPRFRAGKKSEKADYDFDYDDGSQEGDELFYDDPLTYEDYAPAEETYAEDDGYYEEDSYEEAPETYEEEGIAFDEDSAAYVEEYYAPDEYAVPEEEDYYVPEEFAEAAAQEYYAPEEAEEIAEKEYYAPEETAVAEEEDEYDPFAALSQRAANPAADESFGAYDEDEEEYDEYDEDDYDDFDDFDEEPESVGRKRFSLSGGFLMPALSVIALCAVGAIAFATVTLLGSPKYENAIVSEAPAAETPKVEATAVETERPQNGDDLSETERQAMGLATPAPGTEENQVKARLDSDGRIVPDVGGSVVPIRSTKRSNDDFAGSAMIGNSFVEGMNLWSEIDSLKYICADGVNLDNMIGNYLYYVTVQNYDSIYLCLGLNEIGWSTDTFISKYEKVIDYIRSDGTSKTKNATIYVVSVMPVEEIMETVPGESGSTISLSTILEFNDRLKTMCQEKGCWYLDVYSALANDKGYLPEATAADDHIHFEKTGYRIWTDYMRNHYVDEKLLGE